MTKNVSNLKKLNPTTDFDWSKSLKRFDLNLEFEGHSFDVPISHKGTGFKRLLMVAYFEYLANKKAVQNQIFAIEEPETYLHPSAQEDLLNSIVKISENAQFFLTTHSPIFAGATGGENSILVTKDSNGISSYKKGKQNIIDKIIKELGIKPDYNLLEETKYLIFVEGKDDIHFLNAYAKTVLGKNLEENKILCVIGGGSSLKNYADLGLFKKLKNGTNRYAVFIDGDNRDVAKNKEKERIKQCCDEDQALFCKLEKREIENYCHPSRIKSCAIENIKKKEGQESKNPRIQEINNLKIEIDNNVDVEKYLVALKLTNFKKGLNIDVFNNMTKKEWEETDSEDEIKNFLEEVYKKLNLVS